MARGTTMHKLYVESYAVCYVPLPSAFLKLYATQPPCPIDAGCNGSHRLETLQKKENNRAATASPE